MKGFAADLDVHGEIGADVEGRIDVNEFEATGVLDLLAEGAGFEGGEDELVIAPDEFVAPALELAAAGVDGEFLGCLSFLAGFVDVFEGLEGEDGGADVAGFAGPGELDLAFVVEEEEAEFIGQGFAGLDEGDEVAFLLIGEVVAVGGGGRAMVREKGDDWLKGGGVTRRSHC